MNGLETVIIDIPDKLVLYNGYWCPFSLCRQAISTHGMGYAG